MNRMRKLGEMQRYNLHSHYYSGVFKEDNMDRRCGTHEGNVNCRKHCSRRSTIKKNSEDVSSGGMVVLEGLLNM
jgi:hypothetical protein